MKALVLTEANHFEYMEMPAPNAGAGDALIRVNVGGQGRIEPEFGG
jgi:hypothetical protein